MALTRKQLDEWGMEVVGNKAVKKASPATVKKPVQVPKAAIRFSSDSEPNKTEAEWMERVRREYPDCAVLYEPFNLRLPGGVRYCPDVVVVDREGKVVAIMEVKGAFLGKSANSIRAFKSARAHFPFWRFVFCQKTKNGWATSE